MSDDFNPYATPKAPIGSEQVPDDAPKPTGHFSSAYTIAMVVVVLLVANLVADVVGIGSSLLEIQLLNRALAGEGIGQDEATANDTRQMMIGIFQIGLVLVTAICFWIWMYRSHKNLPALAAQNIKYSPGWAVGCWFIPILNLFRPYQIMQEIWRGSDPARLRSSFADQQGGAAIVGWWWAFWIIGGITGQASFRTAMHAETLELLITSSWLDVANSVVSILCALFAITVVRGIAANQEQRHTAMTAPVTAV